MMRYAFRPFAFPWASKGAAMGKGESSIVPFVAFPPGLDCGRYNSRKIGTGEVHVSRRFYKERIDHNSEPARTALGRIPIDDSKGRIDLCNCKPRSQGVGDLAAEDGGAALQAHI